MRPCGDGVIDFAALLTILAEANPTLNLSLETDRSHADNPPGTEALDMRVELYDEGFLAGHPDLTTQELVEYVSLIRGCEERMRSGAIPSIPEYAAQPFEFDEAIAFIG